MKCRWKAAWWSRSWFIWAVAWFSYWTHLNRKRPHTVDVGTLTDNLALLQAGRRDHSRSSSSRDRTRAYLQQGRARRRRRGGSARRLPKEPRLARRRH